MVDVTGRIGTEQVELNNAATEVTLRMLLAATLAANKQTHEDISKMAKQAGLDPAAVAAANDNLNKVADTGKRTEGVFHTLGVGTSVAVEGFKKLDTALTPLISQLLAGTDKASTVFSTLEKFAGPLSGVVNVFGRLAKFQEENLDAYQKMAKAGVNFGGSLTDMRTAAASTYMTLNEFGSIMKENAGTFAKMGGSVNDGAKAFVAISNTLNKSELGSDLRALGYTSQEVNQGMIDYIAISGGRSRKELQNTEQLAKAGANYLENLDGLSKLTGESKEALAAKMKQDAANEAWQMYLLTLDEAGKEKAIKANIEAGARGGKGAAEALQARLMGLPPQTEAAQRFVGTLQNGNEAINKLADDVTDSSKSMEDMNRSSAELSVGMAKDGERLKAVGSAITMAGKGSEEMSKALGAYNNATRNVITSTQEQIKFEEKLRTESKAQKESEAKAAVETGKAIQELGQTVMAALLPAIKLLTPLMNGLVNIVGGIIKVLTEYKTVTIAIATAAAAYLVTQKTLQVMNAIKAAKAAGGGGLTGGLGILGALSGGKVGGPLGSSAGNPMYVKIVGGGAGGGIEDLLGGKGKPGGKPGGGGKLGMGSLLKGGAGVLGGMALSYAGDKLTESGHEKLGAGANIAGGALTGASTGAMMGSLIGPLGTIIGGALGGVIGGGMSLMDNWDTVKGKKPPEPELPKHAEGGIATKPTKGIFGEAGAEALIPLDKLGTMIGLPKMSNDAMKYSATTTGLPKMSDDASKYAATSDAMKSMTAASSKMSDTTKSLTDILSSKITDAMKSMSGIFSSKMTDSMKPKSDLPESNKSLLSYIGTPKPSDDIAKTMSETNKSLLSYIGTPKPGDEITKILSETNKSISSNSGKSKPGDDATKMLSTSMSELNKSILSILGANKPSNDSMKTMSETNKSLLSYIGTPKPGDDIAKTMAESNKSLLSYMGTPKSGDEITKILSETNKSLLSNSGTNKPGDDSMRSMSDIVSSKINDTIKNLPKMSDDAIKYMSTMGGKESPMDKIKDLLGKISPMAAMGPLGMGMGMAADAASSKFGGAQSSKTSNTESLTKEIETLNKNTVEMLRHLRDISNHTEQGVGATKSLGGNLFKF